MNGSGAPWGPLLSSERGSDLRQGSGLPWVAAASWGRPVAAAGMPGYEMRGGLIRSGSAAAAAASVPGSGTSGSGNGYQRAPWGLLLVPDRQRGRGPGPDPLRAAAGCQPGIVPAAAMISSTSFLAASASSSLISLMYL